MLTKTMKVMFNMKEASFVTYYSTVNSLKLSYMVKISFVI